jgi:hypothetical protein
MTIPGAARADGTTVWPITVRGTYRYHNPQENTRQILWHYEYLDEGRVADKGTVGFIASRC